MDVFAAWAAVDRRMSHHGSSEEFRVASLRSLFFGDAPVPKLPAIPPPGFKALPVEKKIEYVQQLWDSIAADVDQVPLADWQKKLLDERLADHRAHPELARPWSEVRRRVLKNLRSRRQRR